MCPWLYLLCVLLPVRCVFICVSVVSSAGTDQKPSIVPKLTWTDMYELLTTLHIQNITSNQFIPTLRCSMITSLMLMAVWKMSGWLSVVVCVLTDSGCKRISDKKSKDFEIFSLRQNCYLFTFSKITCHCGQLLSKYFQLADTDCCCQNIWHVKYCDSLGMIVNLLKKKEKIRCFIL